MDARIAQILADTEAHGFTFVFADRAKHDVALKQIPVIEVLDTVKFDALQPGIIKASANGTSIRVSSDRVGRDFAYENQRMAKADRDQRIKELNVEWILGIKTTRTTEVPKFAGPKLADGSRVYYDTVEEMDEAWAEAKLQEL